MDEKALGRGIPRRPLQSLIRSARRDGDGDGLISIAPGAPDTTPAPRTPKPPAPSRLSSPARRNEDTLDLPSASGFGKKTGTIRELAKYFGFESVHSGDYSYGKSPVARQIRKRLTPVSDSKIRGRGRPAPDYDVAEVEELIRSDKFLRSKIRRKKFDKEQVTVQEIQNHFEFSNRANVVTALRKAGVEPVGKQRASGSTGRGKPASVYNAEQVHNALEARRNVWTPKEQKSYEMDHELHEKILGFGIGKRAARRFRRGAPNLPKDGDGDGKYSRGPGLPDDTPMPKFQVVSLPDEDMADIATSTGYKRSAKVAVKTALQIEKDVLKKHGDIRKRDTARKAIREMFPNLKKNTFLSPQSRDLNDVEFNYLVGLLHMGGVKPKTAKGVTELVMVKDAPSEGGSMTPQVDEVTGKYLGIRISLNSGATARGNRTTVAHAASPWSFALLPEMREAGYSYEEQDKVFQQSIAMHEYGHAIHYEYGRLWHGVEIGGNLPPEAWKYGFVEGMASTGLRISRNDLNDVFDMSLELARNANPTRSDYLLSLDAANIAFSKTLEAHERMTGQRLSRDSVNLITEFLSKEASAFTAWDGVPEDKREQIRKELRDISGYAGFLFDENPGGQYFEGVAEAISVREMTSGLSDSVQLQPAANRHIRDLLTKGESKERTDKEMSYLEILKSPNRFAKPTSICRGLSGLPEEELNITKPSKGVSLKPLIESLKQEAESLKKDQDGK